MRDPAPLNPTVESFVINTTSDITRAAHQRRIGRFDAALRVAGVYALGYLAVQADQPRRTG